MKAINVVGATSKTRDLLRILAAGIFAAACVSGQTAITTSSLPNGVLSQPYGPVTMSATGGTGVYSWSATGAPAGLTMSTTGVLGGTPAAAGTFSVTVSAASGGVNVSAVFLLTILPTALPLQIPGGGGATQLTLTGGTVAVPYSQTLPASNGNPPYSWSVAGGALPEGLSLSAAGTLSGTPNQAGTYEFTGQVTDASGATSSSIFLIAIAPLPFTITTASPFPNGIVGSDYPAQILTAAGGNAPYTFQITGGLPGGLTFSAGEISGIPTTSGIFPFTVTATDSSSPALTASARFQLTIQATRTDLILSLASLEFSLNSGATGVPSGANVSVRSSVAGQLLNYSLLVSPAAPWLNVTGGGTTPGTIGINLTSQALSLAAGVHQTSIIVTCGAPSSCAGNTQTVNVTLNVTAAASQLATSSLLSFSAQTSNPQPVSQTLGLQNMGGGTITVNSVTAANSFVTISGVPATIPAGPAVPVTVTVNPTGLSAGYYQSTISVNTSAGSVSVPVTLLLAQNGTMTLNPAGIELESTAGSSPGNSNGSFLVGSSGSSAVNWTATLIPGASWLTLNTNSGSSTSANPGAVSFSINATAATLAPGAYYGTIQIASNSVVDSPQNFLVVLNVAPAASPVRPDPAPQGLVFISNGSGAPSAQTVQVFAGSSLFETYQASSDSPWLLVSPAAGMTSSLAPASSSVSVNLSGLAAGVYRGNVSYALASAVVRTVNVTLIVAAGSATSCVPAHLIPTQTGLVNNFTQPAAWPTQLAVTLLNDCGQPVTNGRVVATFSNGDPALPLNAASTTSGIYVGTWTPRNASGQVAIVATATASGFSAATAQIVGQVTPNAAPLLNVNGTLDAFATGPEVGAPVAPGTIVQIYGSNLAAQVTTNSTVPLPTSLGQTSVYIGGMLAPLYYVSPGQINAQVPFELPAGQTYQVIVSANGALSTPNPIQLTNDAPGIAQFPAGQVIATHSDGVSLIQETSPAGPDEIIVLYLVGMGLTDQNVPSGTASPSTTLAHALDTPTLTLNGAPVTNILFAGLTPTAVGLYQMNFQVPANAPNGDLQLVVTQTSGQSDSAILPVYNSKAPSLTCPAVRSGEVGVA
ncbi:MAG: putative Ig domain-containing protein, partial [Bryobacteraceae bacterium]